MTKEISPGNYINNCKEFPSNALWNIFKYSWEILYILWIYKKKSYYFVHSVAIVVIIGKFNIFHLTLFTLRLWQWQDVTVKTVLCDYIWYGILPLSSVSWHLISNRSEVKFDSEILFISEKMMRHFHFLLLLHAVHAPMNMSETCGY